MEMGESHSTDWRLYRAIEIVQSHGCCAACASARIKSGRCSTYVHGQLSFDLSVCKSSLRYLLARPRGRKRPVLQCYPSAVHYRSRVGEILPQHLIVHVHRGRGVLLPSAYFLARDIYMSGQFALITDLYSTSFSAGATGSVALIRMFRRSREWPLACFGFSQRRSRRTVALRAVEGKSVQVPWRQSSLSVPTELEASLKAGSRD